eukprot:1231164-Prymnesium_polylepis.1
MDRENTYFLYVRRLCLALNSLFTFPSVTFVDVRLRLRLNSTPTALRTSVSGPVNAQNTPQQWRSAKSHFCRASAVTSLLSFVRQPSPSRQHKAYQLSRWSGCDVVQP